MTSDSSPSSPSRAPSGPRRGPVRWIVIVFFGLLCAGFVFRMFQYGYKWLSGAVVPDHNFKALTIWCLVYVVVCGAISFIAYRFTDEEEEPGS